MHVVYSGAGNTGVERSQGNIREIRGRKPGNVLWNATELESDRHSMISLATSYLIFSERVLADIIPLGVQIRRELVLFLIHAV